MKYLEPFNRGLLKFSRDRCRCLCWLFEAKKRDRLSLLNHMVTSNHIHLSRVARDFENSTRRDKSERNAIPNSIQMIAGRTGQQFNQRKNRKGAYWEDRYHATAVETDRHLKQCLVYMDLNMVATAVVGTPQSLVDTTKSRHRVSGMHWLTPKG